MTTPPLGSVPASPTIPLTDELRAAYQDLYNQIEAAIKNTTDAATLEALNPWQAEVDDVLTKDSMYRLEANDALFDALLKQISYTNEGLETLKAQVAAITTHFAQADAVIAAIDKVLSLVS